MSGRDDIHLVEYLYGELSPEDTEAYRQALEADPERAEEVASLTRVLETVRSVEDADPPSSLDAFVLREAREVAAARGGGGDRGWAAIVRKILGTPSLRLAAAGALAALIAVVLVPAALVRRETSSESPAFEPAFRSAPPKTSAPEPQLAGEQEFDRAAAPAEEAGALKAARPAVPAEGHSEIAGRLEGVGRVAAEAKLDRDDLASAENVARKVADKKGDVTARPSGAPAAGRELEDAPSDDLGAVRESEPSASHFKDAPRDESAGASEHRRVRAIAGPSGAKAPDSKSPASPAPPPVARGEDAPLEAPGELAGAGLASKDELSSGREVAKKKASVESPPAPAFGSGGLWGASSGEAAGAGAVRGGASPGRPAAKSGPTSGAARERMAPEKASEAVPPSPPRPPPPVAPPEAEADAATSRAESQAQSEEAPATRRGGDRRRSSVAAAAPREKEQDTSTARAQRGAGAVLHAADALRATGDRDGARRLLRSALSRARGTPAAGALSLKLAELELEAKRYAEALEHAKTAADTPEFRDRARALDVIERIARAIGSEPDVEWARARRAKMEAEEATPAATDR